MGNLRNCTGGSIAGVETLNGDCPCGKEIADITQSADLTQLYITYTDGTTQTFTLPTATAVGSGEIILWNDDVDHATVGTGLQTLSSGTTDPSNSAKNLSKVGDKLEVLARYKLTGTKTDGITSILLTYTDTLGALQNKVLMQGGLINIDINEYTVGLNRTANNGMRVTGARTDYVDSGGGVFSFNGAESALVDIVNVDYTKPIVVAGQGSSTTGGDNTLQVFTGIIEKILS